MFSFDVLLFLSGFTSAIIAALSGFGIGSFLTPFVSLELGTKTAIAVVAIPHFIGNLVRFSTMKVKINKRVFIQFGITSIIGSLIGALLFSEATSPTLTLLFGTVLILEGLMEFAGFYPKFKFNNLTAFVGGGLSGLFGGLVGNQGGIRSAALLHFEIDQQAFMATTTAIGLVVDFVRLPIYFYGFGNEIFHAGNIVILATLGVSIGSFLGVKLLPHLPKKVFRYFVAGLIIVLGLFILCFT